MIEHQFKLMSASPAFKIDQKNQNMLVKRNCRNQYVLLLQHLWKIIQSSFSLSLAY